MSGIDGVERVLAVMAHPDDIEFGCAGTIVGWVQAGVTVTYCIVTDGAAGGYDEAVPRNEIAAIRQGEQRAAAAVVGVDDVVFLGYSDGRLVVSHELRRDISRIIRQRRPQRILCQSPERRWDRIQASHPDHLAAGEATICAVYPDARNPFSHPELLAEGLRPHQVDEVWLTGPGQAEVVSDVTDKFAVKLAALKCHASQVEDWGELEVQLRQWGGELAKRGGLGTGRLAEVFRVIDTR